MKYDWGVPNCNVLLQDVLSDVMTNAGGTPMTVAEATLIADNALEHTVRCILAAMAAPEVLKSMQGELPHATYM